jgi:hypothetical protein
MRDFKLKPKLYDSNQNYCVYNCLEEQTIPYIVRSSIKFSGQN